MTETEQRAAATKFYNDWRGKGDEKSDSQRFWIEFFTKVLGVEDATQKITFEKRVVVDGQTKYIDVYIPETRVLIEQKSIEKELDKQYQQSGGWMATPFQQGWRYSQFLPVDEAARWIVVSNFRSFEIHDMNKPNDEPTVVLLEEVRNKLPKFDFMFKKNVKELSHEMEISVKAGEIVGILYDKLLAQYIEPNEQSLKSLNALCVRLVFCLYAEDAGIFGSHMMFHDYLQEIPANGVRKALIELFRILDTKMEDRDKYLSEENPKLAAFPYVNGGLFADESIEIPLFTDEIKELLLHKASEDFDWSDISPTIFGAVFESTLNPETRRNGGMHYTSLENIHKVIDPLFLDELKEEFKNLKEMKTRKINGYVNPIPYAKKMQYLNAFQEKLSSLTFLDPACGSGNFLTETYISLRRLENAVIREKYDYQKENMHGQITLETINPIKVSISQFYGIEINDFAVTVAKTALWIAESQMMKETEAIVHMSLDFLPLKSYANIVEGNALRMDWENVISKKELNYIMGNPPFVGYSLQSKEQKEDILSIYVDEKGKPYQTAGKIDYVAGWYFKASQFMQNTQIRTAFVSTNSITQGEQVAGVWKPLYDRFGVHIDFAHRTFRWDSEASLKAHVHCVIVGFSVLNEDDNKILYFDGEPHNVQSITPYLLSGKICFIESRKNPICDVPQILKGSSPVDGGNFLLSDEEKNEIIEKEPCAEKYIHCFLGAKEFLHNIPRFCLWLENISPKELNQMPLVRERVAAVKKFREESTKEATRKYAQYATRFMEIRQPKTNYILIPRHSSENRRYIPMGFMDADIICGDANIMIPDASLFHFGVLISNVHMAWMRAVCGRIKSDYRYSNDIVYNNFPWCNPTDEQRHKIEQTAQGILDARALYPDSSLADLYDELSMPPELRKAHTANDKAVMQAYGFSIKDTTEESCVAELMKMYQTLVDSSSNQ